MSQAAARTDALAVDTGDDVADAETGSRRGTVVDDLGDHHSGLFRDPEVRTQLRRQVRQLDTEKTAAEVRSPVESVGRIARRQREYP